MAATVMFLSPATRRISPGSPVTIVFRLSGADWMTAPVCESATETPVRSRMPAAALALAVSSGLSAIRSPVRKDPRRGGPIPASLDTDCRGYHHPG
jgi:hypothetical protein